MPTSTEFQVNTYTAGVQANPSVTALSNGSFVATWNSTGQDSDDSISIFAQMYNADGTTQGNEFQVNTYTTYYQDNPSVTALNNGGFVVIWDSYGQDSDGSNGVYAQMYNADGTTQGSEFQVNTYTTGSQGNPSITALTNGGFVVTWESSAQDGDASGIYAQMYDADGIPLSADGSPLGSTTLTIDLPDNTGTIGGSEGVDTLAVSHNFADMTTGINTDDNGNVTVIITDVNGNTTTITDVENFNFSDQSFDTAGLHANTEVRDLFYEMVLNDAGTAYDQVYVMPELFLFPGNPALEALYDYSYVMPTDNTVGDIIVGSSGNDFINGMGGGDGIIAGDGNDVIDGGLGSNFLTGGNGDDVFFADGRGAHVAGWTREDDEVWTTVTDFNNGNSQATIWGYIDGTSTYTWEANQGAAGWEGITLRADLDGNGVVDTSFTFTGIDNQSELTLTTNVVGDLGYILVS